MAKAANSADGRGSPAARLIWIALLGAAAVALAWAIVRSSAVNAYLLGQDSAALLAAPDDPRIAADRALSHVVKSKGEKAVPAEARAALMRAIRREPLLHEPFFVEGMEAMRARDYDRGRRLLEESLRRDPRSRLTRLILLDEYFRSGEVDKAASSITVLARLLPAASDMLVEALADFATDPSTLPALQRALRRDPPLLDRVLGHLASKGAQPETILALSSAAGAGPGESGWRGTLLNRLVEQGQIARALDIWNRLGPRPQRAAGNHVYDPAFADISAPAPFGWRLQSGDRGVAEPAEGGLHADYFGREPVELATQLLLLRPGAYRLSFVADGDASGEGSRLGWTITCSGSKAEIATLEAADVESRPKQFSLNFTVPAGGCAGQWLKLRGLPNEFPESQTATFRQVQVGALSR